MFTSSMGMNIKLDAPMKLKSGQIPHLSISSFMSPNMRNIMPNTLEKLINNTFRIVEVVDQERIETMIDLLPTGAAVIRDCKNAAAAVTRASWRILDTKKTLQIAIERTYQVEQSSFQ